VHLLKRYSTWNNYHNTFCSTGKDSWCAYQRDKALGTTTTMHSVLLEQIVGVPIKEIKHLEHKALGT
jgi:hypothetical protein